MKSEISKRKYVVITRSIEDNEQLKTLLEHENFNVYSLPCIERHKIPLSKENQHILEEIVEYDWIVFTSAYGVHSFFKIFGADKKQTTSLGNINVAAVGPATQKAIESYDVKVDFVPPEYTSVSLAKHLPNVNAKKVVIFRSAIAPKTLPNNLSSQGALVTDIPIYTTKKITDTNLKFEELLSENKIEALVFTSTSTVLGFLSRIKKEALRTKVLEIPAVAIGPEAEKTLKEQNFDSISTAPVSSVYSIISTLKTMLA